MVSGSLPRREIWYEAKLAVGINAFRRIVCLWYGERNGVWETL